MGYRTDQICINQHDPVERSAQVQRMRLTYERAVEVVAWQGHIEDRERALVAIQVLKTMYDSAGQKVMDAHLSAEQQEPGGLGEEMVLETSALSLTEELEQLCLLNDTAALAVWAAFARLFRAGFWSRIWIIQELVVAKSITLAWDTLSIEWGTFKIFLEIMTYLQSFVPKYHQCQAPECNLGVLDLDRPLLSNTVRISQILYHRHEWRSRNSVNILELLFYGKLVDCTDERDHIFGLCGLLDPKYPILPDYTKTIQQVFVDTTLAMMSAESSLDIIAQCQHPRPSDHLKKLPTWCPDFSAPLVVGSRRMRMLHCRDDHLSSTFKASGSTISHYTVTKGELDTQTGLLDYLNLQVTGLIIGAVQLGPLPQGAVKVNLQDLDTRGLELQEIHIHGKQGQEVHIHGIQGQEIHVHGVQEHGIHVHGVEEYGIHIHGGDEQDIHMQEKHIPEMHKDFENLLQSWSKLVSKHRTLTEDVSKELRKTAMIDNRGYHSVQPRPMVGDIDAEGMKRDALNGERRFVITQDGIMGMAPPHVKQGDLACVLLGSRVPYVLRKEADFYTLVGELYLSDGFMDGRAIDMMEQGQIELQTLDIR